MRLNVFVLFSALAVFAAAAPAGRADASRGTLALSGGITATIKLSPANCTTGPGQTFAVNGVSAGDWGLVFLKASNPAGRQGAAVLNLEAQGFRSQDAAVAIWSWSARKNSGHLSEPSLHFSGDGQSGAISKTVPLVGSENGPTPAAVHVRATWSSGTCKASE